MSFESSSGYEVDIVYGTPHPKVEIYYGDGWPDGSGKVVLSYEDIRKILTQLNEELK